MAISGNELEELARTLAEHPGEWFSWPGTFLNDNEARLKFEALRDGADEDFKVDSAAFQWRRDEFYTILDSRGLIHMEVRCAW